MQATTIKLDPKVHASLRRMKPRALTLTAFVRELVAREEKRRALESAAEAYHTLLSSHHEEADWLASWEGASLAEASRPKRRRA